MQYAIAYLAAAAAFLLIDLLWLGKIARSFYRSRLRGLLLDRFRYGVGGLFYAVYVVGIVIFAIAPAESSMHAALLGALFGFFAYGTYDMTNLATLKGWPASVSAVDIAWGTLLTGTAAWVGFLASHAVAA